MSDELVIAAIKPAFIFLVFAFFVSTIVEAIASLMRWRACTLIEGMKELLNDRQFNGLALRLYNHPRINPLGSGFATSESDLKYAPDYIDSKQFGDALISVTNIARETPGELEAAIDTNITNPRLNDLLKDISSRTGGDLDKIRDELADWFDASMDSISGTYKRKTEVWSFVVGLTLAVGLNFSLFAFETSLWRQPMIERMMPTTTITAGDALQFVSNMQLPLGWTLERLQRLLRVDGIGIAAGWLMTALTTVFGAPLWFDGLQQIARLKGSGPSPAKRSRTSQV
jgi:hypothetical protein